MEIKIACIKLNFYHGLILIHDIVNIDFFFVLKEKTIMLKLEKEKKLINRKIIKVLNKFKI